MQQEQQSEDNKNQAQQKEEQYQKDSQEQQDEQEQKVDNIEDEELNRCEKCQKIPEKYIALYCGHNFCLTCIQESFMDPSLCQKTDQSAQIVCEICSQVTTLDSNSILAIEEQIKNQQISDYANIDANDIEQNENSDNYNKKIKKKFYPQQPSSNTQNVQQFQQSPSSRYQPAQEDIITEESGETYITDDINKLKQYNYGDQQEINSQDNINDNRQLNLNLHNRDISERSNFDKMSQNIDDMIKSDKYSPRVQLSVHCDEHPLEEAVFFCFTCEQKCICLHCLTETDKHKSHIVKNVNMSSNLLKQKLECTQLEIKQSIQSIQTEKYNLKKQIDMVLNKKQEIKDNLEQQFTDLVDQLLQFKDQILNRVLLKSQQSITKLETDADQQESTMKTLLELSEQLQQFQKQYKISRDQNENIVTYNYYAESKRIFTDILLRQQQSIIKASTESIFNLNGKLVYDLFSELKDIILNALNKNIKNFESQYQQQYQSQQQTQLQAQYQKQISNLSNQVQNQFKVQQQQQQQQQQLNQSSSQKQFNKIDQNDKLKQIEKNFSPIKYTPNHNQNQQQFLQHNSYEELLNQQQLQYSQRRLNNIQQNKESKDNSAIQPQQQGQQVKQFHDDDFKLYDITMQNQNKDSLYERENIQMPSDNKINVVQKDQQFALSQISPLIQQFSSNYNSSNIYKNSINQRSFTNKLDFHLLQQKISSKEFNNFFMENEISENQQKNQNTQYTQTQLSSNRPMNNILQSYNRDNTFSLQNFPSKDRDGFTPRSWNNMQQLFKKSKKAKREKNQYYTSRNELSNPTEVNESLVELDNLQKQVHESQNFMKELKKKQFKWFKIDNSSTSPYLRYKNQSDNEKIKKINANRNYNTINTIFGNDKQKKTNNTNTQSSIMNTINLAKTQLINLEDELEQLTARRQTTKDLFNTISTSSNRSKSKIHPQSATPTISSSSQQFNKKKSQSIYQNRIKDESLNAILSSSKQLSSSLKAQTHRKSLNYDDLNSLGSLTQRAMSFCSSPYLKLQQQKHQYTNSMRKLQLGY